MNRACFVIMVLIIILLVMTTMTRAHSEKFVVKSHSQNSIIRN